MNLMKGQPMRLVFTQMFQDVCPVWFGIREADVQDALAAPDAQQWYQMDDLMLGFYTKRRQRSGSEAYLLVCTRKIAENQAVDLAFWIFPDLTAGLNLLEPLILLQQLVGRFGLTLRVGNQLNKFIFRETIIIHGLVNASQVVELINPENHRCVQSSFIKVIENGDAHHLHCALAYCIDTDEYTRWLMRAQAIGDISFQIAPRLQRHVTPQSLISAEGTLEFRMNYNQLGEEHTGKLFRVESRDYYLEVGLTPTHFHISRNGETLERELQPVYMPTGDAHFFAMWEPTRLRLIVLDESYGQALADGAEPEQALGEHTSLLHTTATVPPFSLVNATRKLALLPIMQYRSKEELYQQVVSALDTIPDKVTTTTMYSAFWDNVYEGRRLKSRTPKRETEIHPTIHGLLFDIAIAKNLEISPEYQIAGGRLDFLFTGTLTTGETVPVCVEFKHAHSGDDLFHGLVEQLPAYMRAKGSDFGIYCVTYFKGRDFNKPEQYDAHTLEFALEAARRASGLQSITIRIFDLSRQRSPSQA
jgi:hypothetical protein